MTLHELWDWIDRYDGTRTDKAVDIYLELCEFGGLLGSEDPDVVTDAARHVWLAACIEFLCSYHSVRPIVDGAWEISREELEETYEIRRQTRRTMSSPDVMASEVYDHLCIVLPRHIEEWREIKEAVDRRR